MEIALAFFIGVASSALVALFFYARQRKDARESQRKLVAFIEYLLDKSSGKMSSTMADITQSQTSLDHHFADLRKEVEAALRASSLDAVQSPAFPSLAGAVASDSVAEVMEHSPSSRRLTLDLLMSLHKKLFPAGYDPAGKLRQLRVWIGSRTSTPESAVFVPLPPEQVPSATEALVREWTESYPQLAGEPESAKIHAIAQFHHRFLTIHPFLDGNGTMARLLLAMQIRDLIGKDIETDIADPDYFSALDQANLGDLSPLETRIHRLLGA